MEKSGATGIHILVVQKKPNKPLVLTGKQVAVNFPSTLSPKPAAIA